MKISVSADAKNLTVHANREVNFQTLATYLGIIAWDIEKMQVLNGQKDWGFEFIVKDIETEKVLYTAFFQKKEFGYMKVFGMNLKNKERSILSGVLFLIISCSIFIYFLFVKEEKITITSIPAPDIQEQIDEYIKAGKCNNGYINEDETGVIIELTEWQRRKWLESEYISMNNMIEQANAVPHMKIAVSENTEEMIIYVDKEVSFETLATYLGIVSYSVEIIQVLEDKPDWGFEFTAKDMKTKEILYHVNFPEEKIKLYESYWDEIE